MTSIKQKYYTTNCTNVIENVQHDSLLAIINIQWIAKVLVLQYILA